MRSLNEAWAILNHESQMARRLNHPGILRTGTPLREGDRTVLPMEFAGGGDLKRLRGKHTGLVSVQLLPPGTTANDQAPQEAPNA